MVGDSARTVLFGTFDRLELCKLLELCSALRRSACDPGITLRIHEDSSDGALRRWFLDSGEEV